MIQQNRKLFDPAGAVVRAFGVFGTAVRKSGLIAWPTLVLGPRPGLKEINLVCWGLFFGCVVIPVSFVFWLHLRAGQIGDFVYFYGIGRIANEYPPAKLYDYAVQVRVFNAISPLHTGDIWGPSPYPPLVARFFSLFARIPFKLACIVWAGISLAFYLTGIAVTVRKAFPEERLKRSLIFCFALAFPPFLLDTLVNGQLSTVAVCCIGLAILEERHSKPFLSGLVLSILTYKPTLLLLLLPMLLLTRKFRTLFGFMTGAVAVFLASTALDGIGIWPAYLNFLRFFSGILEIKERGPFRHWQFLDLRTLSLAIPGGRSSIAVAISICLMIAVLLWFSLLCIKSTTNQEPAQSLIWAAVLTWTLLLNVYVPIYDAPLVVIAMILTLGALRALGWTDATGWMIFFAILIFAVSWNTESVAQRYGVQPLTVLLLILGLGQLLLLDQAVRREPSQTGTEILAD